MSTIYKYLCAMIIIGSSYVSCAMLEPSELEIHVDMKGDIIDDGRNVARATYGFILFAIEDTIPCARFTLPTSFLKERDEDYGRESVFSRAKTRLEMAEIINKINRQGRYKMPEFEHIITECKKHFIERAANPAPNSEELCYACQLYEYVSGDGAKIAIVFYPVELTNTCMKMIPPNFAPEAHLDISSVTNVGSITVPEGGFIVKVVPEGGLMGLDELD